MDSNGLEHFLNRIHQSYVDARKPLCSDALCESVIERGRSRTISGIAEDYFAELLSSELGEKDLHFFIDQPLVGGAHKVYPDVMITRCLGENRFEILYMLDLKMDIGYHRVVTAGATPKQNYIEKAQSLLSEDLTLLRNVPLFELTTKSGSLKKSKVDHLAPRYYFSLHSQASYDEVIITSKNSGSKAKEKELIEYAKDPNSNIWVLSIGSHPNEYRDELDMHPFCESWTLLIRKIRGVVEAKG